jgi:hypothetical protein
MQKQRLFLINMWTSQKQVQKSSTVSSTPTSPHNHSPHETPLSPPVSAMTLHQSGELGEVVLVVLHCGESVSPQCFTVFCFLHYHC